MSKAYDYGRVLGLLAAAQEDWNSQSRVTRRTYVQLRRALPPKMGDRMDAQLRDYQSPFSTRKAITRLKELPAWRDAERWAAAGAVRMTLTYLGKTPYDAEAVREASQRLAAL